MLEQVDLQLEIKAIYILCWTSVKFILNIKSKELFSEFSSMNILHVPKFCFQFKFKPSSYFYYIYLKQRE